MYVDGLTGVRNRRCFDEQLESEWGRAQRNQTPLSLLMLDVDFFKRYNDRYGHPSGDVCLRRVARLIGETLKRPGDQIARYGGEEFACLLPETDLQAATQLANAIRQNVFSAQIEHLDSPPDRVVTVSVGVCTTSPPQGGVAHDLLCQADVLLYAAKAGGRNRVCSGPLEGVCGA